jgi:hypothetical protein
MIMAALSTFLVWLWLGVGIGKFLNDLGVINILDTILHVLGACLCLAVCLFCCITVVGRMLCGVKSAHRETGTE